MLKENAVKMFVFCMFSPLLFAQTSSVPQETSTDENSVNSDQVLLDTILSRNSSLRCVPADKQYTHFGVVDEKTLILANQENATLLARLRFSCPRVLDEGMVFLLFRKGDGLSRIGSRMCADDAFMMVRDNVVSVKNSDSQRACEFREFYPLPLDDALGLISANAMVFKRIGVL